MRIPAHDIEQLVITRIGDLFSESSRLVELVSPYVRTAAQQRYLLQRAVEFAGVRADELVQAMVSEYSVGTPIGWHRDAPPFGTIVGISLGSACRMRGAMTSPR